MKLGILGGTFNPPHIGHLIIAESVRDQLKLDKILFVPSYSPPHKLYSQVALPTQRYEMVEIALEKNRNFSVSDIEIAREGKSYTIDTINTLMGIYPGSQLYLIIGLDNLMDFSDWKSPNDIISKVELVVMNRPGYDVEVKNEFKRYATIVKVPGIDISSSDIRRRVKMGRSIRYLVPFEIEQYILKKSLYKS
jgi:nicotinate-nucleotide adenylyltransferase